MSGWVHEGVGAWVEGPCHHFCGSNVEHTRRAFGTVGRWTRPTEFPARR